MACERDRSISTCAKKKETVSTHRHGGRVMDMQLM